MHILKSENVKRPKSNYPCSYEPARTHTPATLWRESSITRNKCRKSYKK